MHLLQTDLYCMQFTRSSSSCESKDGSAMEVKQKVVAVISTVHNMCARQRLQHAWSNLDDIDKQYFTSIAYLDK